jgi:multisubunit Na+/H+ antiporter MnhB subunit
MIAADALLAALLIAVGAAALLVRDLRVGAILFVFFGLLLALAWVRLGAPDVALAEAAIGAGVTGALLIDAAAQLHPQSGRRGGAALRGIAVATGAVCLLLTVALAAALLALPANPGEASARVVQSLAASEVAHPVTAVLLAFRAYDTLLEVGVLLVAVVAAQALPPIGAAPVGRDPVLARVVGTTVPIAVLVGVYLLWAGATRTGGAFQAGAVLAGALLLARFSGLSFELPPRRHRLLLATGFAVFIAVAVAGGLAAGAVHAYPLGWGGALILAVEAALTVSIALSLAALFGLGERR